MITIDEGSDGRVIDLKEGQEFEVVLPENPTTGYRWRLESAGSPVCAAIDEAYEPPAPAIPGRGGVHRWRFRCDRKGVEAVILSLGRAWEKAGTGGRAFRVEVRVTRG